MTGLGGRPTEIRASDVVVIGGGAAGLVAALGLEPARVDLLTRERLGEGGATPMAQGGVAVALGAGDSPALHAADTLAVAGELAAREVVEALTAEGPRRIAELLALGARFDRDGRGGLALGREAAHGRRRIVHAQGDATGAELSRTLVAAVRAARHVTVSQRRCALELWVDAGRVVGVLARRADGGLSVHLAPAVVLASGGIGRLYSHTTNPPGATGDGLAMAARAGALLVDLEMVQFHPTALAVGADPMPLLTEALRGAGAILVDRGGRRFMPAVDPAAELAPRDVVARAIWRRQARGEESFLDVRALGDGELARRFPTVCALCRRHGLDPGRDLLPVAPAAHYHMGGVWTDAAGRSSLPGLWACGEVASTGVHGANRLASNSLLEALVFGARVAADITSTGTGLPLPAPPPRATSWLATLPGSGARGRRQVARLRELMWRQVGLERDAAGLRTAAAGLAELAAAGPGDRRAASLLTVGRLVTAAALERRESRGAHFRRDHPTSDPAWRRRLLFRLEGEGERPVGAGSLAVTAEEDAERRAEVAR